MNPWLLLAGLGVGAYMMFKKKTSAAPATTQAAPAPAAAPATTQAAPAPAAAPATAMTADQKFMIGQMLSDVMGLGENKVFEVSQTDNGVVVKDKRTGNSVLVGTSAVKLIAYLQSSESKATLWSAFSGPDSKGWTKAPIVVG